jgi:nitrogen fixation NifU-like protein
MDQDIIDEIQQMILDDAREVFSETVLDHAMNPRNVGIMQDSDCFGSFTGSCGDSMQVWLKVKDDVISGISFMTDGCGTSIASGSMMTEMAKGKSIADAQSISPGDILVALEGLPEESEHCALLSATTLKAAITDYYEKQ